MTSFQALMEFFSVGKINSVDGFSYSENRAQAMARLSGWRKFCQINGLSEPSLSRLGFWNIHYYTLGVRMTIQLSRFGEILVSRPEGRESALILLASDLREEKDLVELSFDGIVVMTPSWLSEFIQTLTERGVKKVHSLKSNNASVIESIKFVELEFKEFNISGT